VTYREGDGLLVLLVLCALSRALWFSLGIVVGACSLWVLL
jgi:hypothetical protein